MPGRVLFLDNKKVVGHFKSDGMKQQGIRYWLLASCTGSQLSIYKIEMSVLSQLGMTLNIVTEFFNLSLNLITGITTMVPR